MGGIGNGIQRADRGCRFYPLEELVRSFNLQNTIGTLGASASAMGEARCLLGPDPDFRFAVLPWCWEPAYPLCAGHNRWPPRCRLQLRHTWRTSGDGASSASHLAPHRMQPASGGLFAPMVRAPLTGIILAIELPGTFTLFLPMLAACFAVMLVPTLCAISRSMTRYPGTPTAPSL